jgi:hypothetical protein
MAASVFIAKKGGRVYTGGSVPDSLWQTSYFFSYFPLLFSISPCVELYREKQV